MNAYLYAFKDEPATPLVLEGCANHIEQGSYFEALLRSFEEQTAGSHLTIYLTWNTQRFAVSGPRVVAIMVGDERGTVPPATDEVLAVFRTGTQGLESLSLFRPRMPASERLLEGARLMLKLHSRLRRWLAGRSKLLVPGNVFSIPLMPSYPEDIATAIPFAERRWDISFFGTVGPVRRLFGSWRISLSPKAAARLDMLRNLKTLRQTLPQLTVNAGCDSLPEWPRLLSPAAYAEALRHTRISLCPRGNFAETFRLAESARAGCVVITDPLPKEWYFSGHPFIEIQRWSDLPTVVAGLIAEPHRMAALAAQSREWWETHLSPESVASHMASTLRPLIPPLTSGA